MNLGKDEEGEKERESD